MSTRSCWSCTGGCWPCAGPIPISPIPASSTASVSSDDDAGWLRIERGAFLVAVNFRAEATVVDLPGELELLLTVGEVGPPSGSGNGEATDQVQLRLGPHSALVARALSAGPRSA